MESSDERSREVAPLDYERAEVAAPVSGARKGVVVAILIVGVAAALWFEVRGAMFSPRKGYSPSWRSMLVLLQRIGPVLLAAGLCVIPVLREWIWRGLEKIARPSDRKRRIATVVIAILAAGYFLFAASW